MIQQDMAPNRLHFIAIGILSLSMIAIQVLITRIFSVVFYYHFAFAGITFAMLGLTIGALRVYSNPARFTSSSVNAECANHALRAAILLVIATLAMADISGRLLNLANQYDSEIIKLIAVMVLVAGPLLLCYVFIFLGTCITMLLTYFPSYTNRLYAVDLICAATGCVSVVAALGFLDPISILFLLAGMLAILAMQLAKHATSPINKRIFPVIAAILCSMFLIQSSSYFMDRPFFHLRIGKLNALEEFKFERWNSFTHVGIYPKQEPKPFGWGLGTQLHVDDYQAPEQYWLKIDADAGTVLTGFNGDLNRVGYLKYDVINFGYHLRDIQHTAVIGVGGGRDILSALTFGVKNITGIEINPAIFEALNDKFADFTGRLSSYPGVNLVNSEARSYISSHDTTYDMVQISLIDTWAATAAGGLTLSENKLYTKEAWDEFLGHLNPDGILSVSRWFSPDKHKGELYRLLSLASESLKSLDPDIVIKEHVIALNANDIITLIVSKSAFNADDIRKIDEICKKYGFTALITPSRNFDDITRTILSGNATDDFYSSLPLDVTASTDDRPFFFNMARFSSLFLTPLEGRQNLGNNLAIYVLAFLAVTVLLFMAYAIIWPMRKLYTQRREEFANSSPFAFYFLLIGLGFMFIEMSLMQWLMIFLGHPVYALSVILFTLLLFSGIGSYTVRYHRLSGSTCIMRTSALCLLLAATLWMLPHLRQDLIHNNIQNRILFSVILLIPVSLFLGMMFPLGVAAAKKRHAQLLPWFWALNGAASVFASIFSVVISMSYGASTTYAVGLACYVICFFIMLYMRRDLATRGSLC